MPILLFLDTINNVYDSTRSTSDWWAIVFSILVAFGVLMLQQRLEVLRNKKKLLLKLYNFKKHIDHIIAQRKRILLIFNKYLAELEQHPFEQIMLVDHLIIPDFARMLDIDKNDIFLALINSNKANKDAASSYRKVYNSIEYYKQIFNLLYDTYKRDAQEFYNRRVIIKDKCLAIEMQLNRIIISLEHNLSGEELIHIHADLLQIRNNHRLKEENLQEAFTQQNSFDYLVDPIHNCIKEKLYTPQIMELYFQTIQAKRDRNALIEDTLQTARFLRGNLGKIPTAIDGLKACNTDFESIVTRVESEKKGFGNWIKNTLDI